MSRLARIFLAFFTLYIAGAVFYFCYQMMGTTLPPIYPAIICAVVGIFTVLFLIYLAVGKK